MKSFNYQRRAVFDGFFVILRVRRSLGKVGNLIQDLWIIYNSNLKTCAYKQVPDKYKQKK